MRVSAMTSSKGTLILATLLLPFMAAGCSEEATRPGSTPGPAGPDSIPPATVLDLVAEPVTPTSVLLAWTASGDDGREGTATGYDIRHSFWHVMTARGGFWDSSVPIAQSLTPRAQGECECLLVTGLDPDTLYYFGVRVGDEESNWSAVSNVASYRTELDEPFWGAYDGEFVALRLSGQLLAPPELVERVTRDLALIRARYPYMKTIGVFSTWRAGDIFVRLGEDAWSDFERGEYHGLDGLNSQYGPVDYGRILPPYVELKFDRAYNSVLLAEIYEQAEGVVDSYAAGVIGDGSDIHCDRVGDYAFEKAWGDCLLGCAYHHYWFFEVEGCEVELADEYGYPLPDSPGPVEERAFGPPASRTSTRVTRSSGETSAAPDAPARAR
jgi:hypothetical protein